MSNSNEKSVIVSHKEKNQIKDIFTKAFDVMAQNELIQEIMELARKKRESEDEIIKMIKDVNYAQLYIIDRMDELEGNFDTGINYIQEEISKINEKITPSKTIVLRKISRKDAKKEIEDFINKNKDKKMFPSEISEKLGISYDLTLKIIQELINKNKIEIVK